MCFLKNNSSKVRCRDWLTMAVVVPHTYLNARQPHIHKLNAIATIIFFSHYNTVNKNNNFLSLLSVLMRISKPNLTIFKAQTIVYSLRSAERITPRLILVCLPASLNSEANTHSGCLLRRLIQC